MINLHQIHISFKLTWLLKGNDTIQNSLKMNAFDRLMNHRVPSVHETPSGYLIARQCIPSVTEKECHLLQFDGLASPNPGKGSGGAILYSPQKDVLYETGEYIPYTTNNMAEYTGLLIGLRLALEKGIRCLLIEGDSQLILYQSLGKWKVKNETLQIYHKEVCDLLTRFDFVAMRHIRREYNIEADRITNETVRSEDTFVTEYEYSL